MRQARLAAVVLIVVAGFCFGYIFGQFGAPAPKVTICHAASQEGTSKFVEVTASWNAIYGEAGHFFENGTPRAGHEEDYEGPCNITTTTTMNTTTTITVPPTSSTTTSSTTTTVTTVPSSTTSTTGPTTTSTAPSTSTTQQEAVSSTSVPPTTPPTELPRTGANALFAAILGVGLVASGTLLRRADHR